MDGIDEEEATKGPSHPNSSGQFPIAMRTSDESRGSAAGMHGDKDVEKESSPGGRQRGSQGP